MKKEEKSNKIEIDNLIALVNIVDYYEEFSKNLKRFVKSSEYNRDAIGKLDRISRDEFCIRDMGARNFYKANKEVIDIINKYSSIYDYICSNYDYRGKFFNGIDILDYYYNYLLKNKNNIEQIKMVLDKIKELGIRKINMDECYDFTDKTFHFSRNYKGYLNYLDNMEMLPSYDKSRIEYCTKGSNYRIIICSFNDTYGYNEIYVNSLVFDPNRLPKEISEEETLNKIVELKEKNAYVDKQFREAILLSVAVDDLENQYVRAKSIISQLDTVKDKKELKNLLISILDNISEIRAIENKHYKDLINSSGKITEKRLVKEKRHYLENNYWED